MKSRGSEPEFLMEKTRKPGALKRALQERDEALRFQAATQEILASIPGSVSDAKPVFSAIIRNVLRLFGTRHVAVFLIKGDELHLADETHRGPRAAVARFRAAFPQKIDYSTFTGKALRSGKVSQLVPIIGNPKATPQAVKLAKTFGYNCLVVAPLVREGKVMGAIGTTHPQARRFTDRELALLKSFADQAVIAIENVRLFNETKESLERQTATAEILKVIASSPSDVQPVFDAIAASARRLLDGGQAVVTRRVGDKLELVAYTSSGEAADAALRTLFPAPITGQGHLGRAILNAAPVGISDIQNDETYSAAFREIQRVRGVRSIVSVPMLRDGELIGVISVNRPVAGNFSEHQTNLLRTFADQAVIAIENVRLFNETKESLERQTATAEILKVISGSPTSVQPVFEAILARAAALCDASFGNVFRYDGAVLEMVAANLPPASMEILRREYPAPPNHRKASGRAVLSRQVVEIPDIQEDPEYGGAAPQAGGHRSLLGVPLLREGQPIGAIVIARHQPGKFTPRQIAMVQTFADQAVIAIENVRLFNETKEALERQTATGEILASISGSVSDTRPVFDAIVTNLLRLFHTRYATVVLLREGQLHLAALQGEPGYEWIAGGFPRPLDDSNISGRAMLAGKVLQVAPCIGNPATPPRTAEIARKVGFNSIIAAPMIREGKVIGAITTARRDAVPFDDKQVALIQSFADQAVIAIENVRLFNETKEGLEQQTAISEVLRVISSSPADVKPVLDAVAVRAARICGALDARIFLAEGDTYRYVAGFGDVGVATPTVPLDRDTPSGRAIIDRAPQHVEDIQSLPEGEFSRAREIAQKAGWRTILSVPLLREGRALGSIVLRRKEVRPFSEKQIALLKTFADQAAIAIENVRLFNETKEALEQQTATAEVLNVISGSITDARPVFDAISRSVLRLYGARSVSLVVRAGERIDRVGYALADRSADDGTQALWPIPLDEQSLSGRAILRDELVHIRDVETEPGLAEHSRAITRQTGVRSVLVAPMHSMGEPTGALAVARRAPGGFSEREVELIRTFADQAVIAMENVRLFREIQEKSAELEVASQHKSQFLASMSHELRTPLNALLGFNEMLLGEVYGEVPGDMKPPLAQMQASGKHLLRLINNVLDLAKIEAGRMELALGEYSVHDTVESVRSTLQPLAAEKGLDFRAAVPQEIPLAYGDCGRISQCLMNLAGNSLKFTKNGKVEITVALSNGTLRYSVADTGIGIPPDKIEGLFTEFKQTDATVASEYGGTGLGLSISKKFVEMHGGRIWAESEPGSGSVFTFEVPLRTRAS
jgi:GAF domain-containing protein